MVSDLDQRALRAAGAVSVAHGLADDSAAVIYSGSNVLVHLRPAPVVARVMTGTVALHDDPRQWLTRELSVLEFLAPTGLAVRPSALITPGPHCQDGLWMTFVEWIPDVDSAVDVKDAGQLARTLRDLHEALAPFTGDLGTLADLGEDIQRLHGKLQPADETQGEAIASLAARLSALRKDVFASTLPVQALHGDVSLRNLIRQPDGLIWNDFEDTFRGPVHWDLASYIGSLKQHDAQLAEAAVTSVWGVSYARTGGQAADSSTLRPLRVSFRAVDALSAAAGRIDITVHAVPASDRHAVMELMEANLAAACGWMRRSELATDSWRMFDHELVLEVRDGEARLIESP